MPHGTESQPPPAAPLAATSRARPLDEDAKKAVQDLITAHGLLGAARALDMPRHTVAMGAAGAALREGTRLMFTARLALVATTRVCATRA